MERCRCCPGACRKPRKKRGGKKQKARRPQEVIVTLKEPTVRNVPRLAPTFRSSIFSPVEPVKQEEVSEREEKQEMVVPSGADIVRRDLGVKRGAPTKEEIIMASMVGLSVTEYRKKKKE